MSENKFEAKTAVKKEVETSAIEAKEVELSINNIQRAAKSLDEVLDQDVRHKYPTKYFAWVSQEDARQGTKGWKYLKFDSGKLTLTEVSTIDSAETTRSNVLCWRDKRIQDYIEKEQKKARDISNRRANQESNSEYQAKGLNSSLSGIAGDKIRVEPLGALE